MWWEINSKQSISILVLTKRNSKVQEKNTSCESMSCEHVLNFVHWKSSDNESWLWLVYKYTENFCYLQLFHEFIQTQKRYPTSLGKVPILT